MQLARLTQLIRQTLPALALAVGTGVAGHALAHHAFAAEFDADQPIEVKGVITKFKAVNPHSWLYLDVQEKDGTTTNWGFEFSAPNALANRGLGKNDIKPGDTISIKGYRSKNGGAFGYSVQATLADGRIVQTGGAQDAPPPNTAQR